LGVPVVARPASSKFVPEAALGLMEEDGGSRNGLHPADGAADAEGRIGDAASPAGFEPEAAHDLLPAGEALGRETYRVGPGRRSRLSTNEFYGQTECNLVLGSCAAPSR
jgi:acetyl-CoA synthetase